MPSPKSAAYLALVVSLYGSAEFDSTISPTSTDPNKDKKYSDKPHYENEVPFEIPSSWIWSTVNEINMYNSKNVDPAKQKENTFELYSVPVFPTNTPETIK